MFEFAIAGVEAPIFLLVVVGLTVGIVGGFIGVGGGTWSPRPSSSSDSRAIWHRALT